MLHQLHPSRPWNTSGYVCRACRHQRSVTRQQPTRLYASTQAQNVEDDSKTFAPFDSLENEGPISDLTWHDNFNSLDAGLPGQVDTSKDDRKARRRLGRQRQARARRESREQEETSLARSRAVTQQNPPGSGRKHSQQGRSPQSPPSYASDLIRAATQASKTEIQPAVSNAIYRSLVETLKKGLAAERGTTQPGGSNETSSLEIEQGRKKGKGQSAANMRGGPVAGPRKARVRSGTVAGEHKELHKSVSSRGTEAMKANKARDPTRISRVPSDFVSSSDRRRSLKTTLLAALTEVSSDVPPAQTSKDVMLEELLAKKEATPPNGTTGLAARAGSWIFNAILGRASATPTATELRLPSEDVQPLAAASPLVSSPESDTQTVSGKAQQANSPVPVEKLERGSLVRRTDSGRIESPETSDDPEGSWSQTRYKDPAYSMPPFGVTLETSSRTTPIIPGLVRPIFSEAKLSPAADALSKLHDSGWFAPPASEQPEPLSMARKRKPENTPKDTGTKGRGEEDAQKPGITRRERLQQSQRGSKTSPSSSRSKEDSESSGGLPAQTPGSPANASIVNAGELEITPLDIPQPPVPLLQYGLDRVLFNPGVYQLQDPHSRVYNFDPYLQNIMPVVEFDYNALKEYKTSSQDVALADLAREQGKRYIGSTSSMTSTLGHFHYLLSAFRPINLDMLSRGFPEGANNFTTINRAPNAIFLRWKNGTYAIDADKEYDGANVLMMLGKSMEKLLTMPTEEFERYRKSDPRAVSEEERMGPEAFQYTTMGDFLMRSQLDAYDPRLPGTGTFDLKTRAVLTVRMNADDYQPMTGYQIHTLQGRFESYEREYYDMSRSTMLKYMLQVRMGRMDGIFIAYHNVERIFGFQYLSLKDMDRALHGQIDTCLGDQEFKVSLDMLNKVFDMATKKFPEQSLRFHFETKPETLRGGSDTTVMWVYAEPMTEDTIDQVQDTSKAKIAAFERTMMGMEEPAAVAESEPTATVDTTAATATSDSEDPAAVQPSDKPTSYHPGDDLAPLFVANIIIRSYVNGGAVTRPEGLKQSDTWKVEHIIQEWPTTQQMWARYVQTKAARKKAFARARGEDKKNGASADGKRKPDPFVTFLREMSARGRQFQKKLDKSEAGKERVVLGRDSQTPVVPEVEGVEEYMSWLYKK